MAERRLAAGWREGVDKLRGRDPLRRKPSCRIGEGGRAETDNNGDQRQLGERERLFGFWHLGLLRLFELREQTQTIPITFGIGDRNNIVEVARDVTSRNAAVTRVIVDRETCLQCREYSRGDADICIASRNSAFAT
jgi:hypothetical protein